MREIRLHDTRSGEVVPLRPRDPGKVAIYACGPTVYSRIHIGNARPFVVFSLLKRFLAHEGYEVTLAINVTDVNDKIYDAARPDPNSADPVRKAGLPSGDLAAEMTSLYMQDTDALGLGRPDHEPLASQTMAEIIAYIATLIERRHAYESGGDVFFDVRSDTAYGSLSHRNIEHMDQGEGEGEWDARSPLRPPARPATRLSIHPSPHPTAAHKRDHLDFALWKAHKQGEDTSWQAPWGMGRPGWHIECSAMAESLLGVGFDIHGGGSDLVFPHHENEAAQTRAARGRQLARIWMHNGMIQATGEKMAKSVGNIALLHEVIERWGREAVIMYLIGGHYRQPLAFSESELEDADRRVHRIREAMRRLDHGATSPQEMARHRDAFFDALADDFNTPKALASLFEWVRDANRRDEPAGDADLMEMLAVIGLGEMEPWGGGIGDPEAIDQEAYELAMEREQARWAKDFARADALRKQIRAKGWEVRDGPQGPELIPLVAER